MRASRLSRLAHVSIPIPLREGRIVEARRSVLEGSEDSPCLLVLAEEREAALALPFADKLAEEGYDVLLLQVATEDGNPGTLTDENAIVVSALDTLFDLPRARARESAAIVGFGRGAAVGLRVGAEAGARVELVIAYDAVAASPGELAEIAKARCPIVLHRASAAGDSSSARAIDEAFRGREDADVFSYPAASAGFAFANGAAYDHGAAQLAYSRTLDALRRRLGPRFDLSALWDEHILLEFAHRDADATMHTMVNEPYVNSVPVMTGGHGHTELLRFYRHHFCQRNPADFKVVPISRTVGTDRLVDEFVMCFTHDIEMDWMLGQEQARRLLEETLPSNRLMGELWSKSEQGDGR